MDSFVIPISFNFSTIIEVYTAIPNYYFLLSIITIKFFSILSFQIALSFAWIPNPNVGPKKFISLSSSKKKSLNILT